MISLYDILEAANGQLFGEPGPQLFSEFCFDSRLAKDSNLYVALKTDQGDGHQYIREAVAKGASGVLCTRPPDFDTEGLSIILVKDTQAALINWSRYILNKLGTKVVAVTGASGKSVAVEAISQVLGTRYVVQRGAGEAPGRLNLPHTLAKLTNEHKMVVIEMDAVQPGEMAEMMRAARPHVAVVTHVGNGHNDRFESVEQLAHEYSTMVEALAPNGLAVLNYDDDRVRQLASSTRARTMTVGIEGFGADLVAYNIVVGSTRTGFDLRIDGNRHVGRWTPMLGKHLLYSLLTALAVGQYFDVPVADALKALTNLPPLPGCMNPLNGLNGSMIIDDTYKSDPQAALLALDWLEAVTDETTRAIFVMGDMDELGEYSQRTHRQVGQRAAQFVKLLVTEGTDAALAGRAALDQGLDRRQVAITYSIQDAVARLKAFGLSSSDIVLIKGGRSARMELVVRELLAKPADSAHLPRAELLVEAASLMRPLRPSWVDIDLEAVAGNVRSVKSFIGDAVALFAVVKADAYGHGASAIARTALLNGASALCVASINEALELRDAGIDAPILVMSYTPVQAVRQAIRQNVTLTVYDIELARLYDQAARESGGKLRAHVKIDTGMGRLGVLATEAVPFFRHLLALQHMEIEGIYTHFSMADEDPVYTAEQVRSFRNVLTPLRAAGFQPKYVHAANSAGVLMSRDNHFNAVRVGKLVYGVSPSELIRLSEEFKPAMTWKTVIAQVKTLPPNHPIGYGNTYRTKDAERVAVLPIGYADGFRRGPHHWGHVLVHGILAPVRGRVSMEKTVISVQHIPDVAIGDEVVLLGRQGDAVITADEIGRRLMTSSYEVLTSILPRVPRR